MTVIGYKGSDLTRRNDWLWMLESKKSHEMFKRIDNEQAQEIAANDDKTYKTYLNRYVA